MNNDKLKQSGVSRVEMGLAKGGDGIAIEHDGKLHVVGARAFVIGRAQDADLVIEGGAVSRRHARIAYGKDGYLVQDLESRNGILVDGVPVRGAALISPGMVLTFGDVSVVVRAARQTTSARADTDADLAKRPTRRDQDTGPVDGLLLFMTTVDSSLIRGETREAEQAFACHLARPAERAAQRGRLDAGVAQTIALLSLRVGEATGSGVWLDFVVRLYSALGAVVPLTVVNAMQALARKLGGVDRSALKQYAAILAERVPELSIEERCVLDRLAALAASHFHPSRAAG